MSPGSKPSATPRSTWGLPGHSADAREGGRGCYRSALCQLGLPRSRGATGANGMRLLKVGPDAPQATIAVARSHAWPVYHLGRQLLRSAAEPGWARWTKTGN